MLLERAEALRQQAACQTAALAERLALQAELSRLREDQHTLRVELVRHRYRASLDLAVSLTGRICTYSKCGLMQEQERERTICRICFSRVSAKFKLLVIHGFGSLQ